VPSEGAGIQKHAQQFLKEAYGVTLQLRGHAARAVKALHVEQASK
jgi:hypothetical protein